MLYRCSSGHRIEADSPPLQCDRCGSRVFTPINRNIGWKVLAITLAACLIMVFAFLIADKVSRRNTISELQKNLQSATTELFKMKEENKKLNAQIVELTNNTTIPPSTNDSETIRLKDDNAKLKAELAELTKSTINLTQTTKELQNALASTSNKLIKTEQELQGKIEEIKKLKKEQTPQSELLEKIDVLTAKSNELQNALASATNDLEKTRKELFRLKDDNAKSEAKVTELTKSNNYLTQKTNELQNALASATIDLEKTRKELSRLKDDNAKLEAKVAELTKSTNNLSQKNNELQIAFSSTQNNLEKTTQELKLKENEIARLNEENAKLKDKVAKPHPTTQMTNELEINTFFIEFHGKKELWLDVSFTGPLTWELPRTCVLFINKVEYRLSWKGKIEEKRYRYGKEGGDIQKLYDSLRSRPSLPTGHLVMNFRNRKTPLEREIDQVRVEYYN